LRGIDGWRDMIVVELYLDSTVVIGGDRCDEMEVTSSLRIEFRQWGIACSVRDFPTLFLFFPSTHVCHRRSFISNIVICISRVANNTSISYKLELHHICRDISLQTKI
jgi:hypothetical protein